MGTLTAPRNLYSYLKNSHIIADIGRKILTGGFYYSNSNYYKAVLGQYVNFKSYINIYKSAIERRSMHTDINIQPDVLGAGAKAVQAKYGKPDFIFHEKELSVLVYKWKLNGLKTRCEIHFYKNKAFLMNYIYNQLTSGQEDYISNSLATKYLHKFIPGIDLMTTKISDRNSNMLFAESFLMGMKVTYMANCESDWFEAMTAYISKVTTKCEEKARISERRFFNRI